MPITINFTGGRKGGWHETLPWPFQHQPFWAEQTQVKKQDKDVASSIRHDNQFPTISSKQVQVMAHDIPSTRVRRALADVLKRAELGLAELGDIENSLEERDRPRYGGNLYYTLLSYQRNSSQLLIFYLKSFHRWGKRSWKTTSSYGTWTSYIFR